ncbi:hypothetical protein G7Z17_g8357 [Cylindrodendrum hubeiense]|uniref:Uncharacterized protein n=1 Tax=Cylindrodendrum hubeiense TaxID=595255 RepID=A0A9P5H638_9HYPO|nr:hypothetical protein G7Z17_g8357 [Cylindrodendrum hubeiense]
MLFLTAIAVLGLVSTSTAAPAPAVLAADDIIVLKTDGSSEVMKLADFQALESKSSAPAGFGVRDLSDTTLVRRACDSSSSEIQVTSDEEFLNWDIAISPVVSSAGGTGTVSVASGYTISNAVSVSESASLTIVKDLLSASLTVSYTETWTTSQTQTLTFTVPDGQHGVIVSEPYVRRVQGFMLEGCSDNWEKTSFMSDSYSSQSYGDMSWVKGVIRLCSSETYPIPYCVGTGEHA